MNTTPTSESILRQIAQIQHLDRGSVSIIRHGPNGPYYNHQCYENGRNVSRYVPADQVPQLQQAIQNYQRFEHLVGQYAQLLIEKTRA